MENKVEEKIKIEVTEEDESIVSQDIVIELNTLLTNETELTHRIDGKLNAIIIESNKVVTIEVFFKQWSDVKILDLVSYGPGTSYIIPKTDASNAKGERFNFGSEAWWLRDDIVFRIKGGHETQVKFTLRLE